MALTGHLLFPDNKYNNVEKVFDDLDYIYSLVGYWKDNHTFVYDGKEYEVWYNHMIQPEMDVWYYINAKYIPSLRVWCAFQLVVVPEKD